MQVGATFERQQALAGAVDKQEVADGGTFTLPLAYLPTSSRAVYIVFETAASAAGTATISGQSDLTLDSVYVAGDLQGASTSVSVGDGDLVRVVFSRLDDGNETTVSEAITISATAAYIVTVAISWTFEDVSDEEFQPYWTHSFRKTYVCAKCDNHFKEGEGALIGGVPYCRRYGCLEEELYERGKRRR